MGVSCEKGDDDCRGCYCGECRPGCEVRSPLLWKRSGSWTRGATNALLGLHQFANTHIDGPRGILYRYFVNRKSDRLPGNWWHFPYSSASRGRESGVEQRYIQRSSLLVLQCRESRSVLVHAAKERRHGLGARRTKGLLTAGWRKTFSALPSVCYTP